MSEPNFFALLREDPDLAALIGNRIFPDMIPEHSPTPAIVFQRLGGRRGVSYCGTDGLALGNYACNVYAATRPLTRQIADRVRDVMLDFTGMMGDVRVTGCALATDFDSVDPDPGLLCRTQLWDVWYLER